MSTCLFLIRDIHATDSLREKLVAYVKTQNFGVDFHPFDGLLIYRQIPLQTWDFVFSLCDSFEYVSCDCVLYPEGYPTNGREHHLFFRERMMVIQHIAEKTLEYSDEVELFLSDDNPYLPEFVDFNVSCQHVAETLCEQYSHYIYPFDIPSVHLVIHRGQGDGLREP